MDNLCNCVHGWVHPWIIRPHKISHPWLSEMSWVDQGRNNFPLYWQFWSTWAATILAAWCTFWLFWCSSMAHFLVDQSPCKVLSQPSPPPRQQDLVTMWQLRWPYLFAASYSASITATTPQGICHYRSQYRTKILVIFLIQQCLKPAGWPSLLQTHLVHLQQLVVGDLISDAFWQDVTEQSMWQNDQYIRHISSHFLVIYYTVSPLHYGSPHLVIFQNISRPVLDTLKIPGQSSWCSISAGAPLW